MCTPPTPKLSPVLLSYQLEQTCDLPSDKPGNPNTNPDIFSDLRTRISLSSNQNFPLYWPASQKLQLSQLVQSFLPLSLAARLPLVYLSQANCPKLFLYHKKHTWYSQQIEDFHENDQVSPVTFHGENKEEPQEMGWAVLALAHSQPWQTHWHLLLVGLAKAPSPPDGTICNCCALPGCNIRLKQALQKGCGFRIIPCQPERNILYLSS